MGSGAKQRVMAGFLALAMVFGMGLGSLYVAWAGEDDGPDLYWLDELVEDMRDLEFNEVEEYGDGDGREAPDVTIVPGFSIVDVDNEVELREALDSGISEMLITITDSINLRNGALFIHNGQTVRLVSARGTSEGESGMSISNPNGNTIVVNGGTLTVDNIVIGGGGVGISVRDGGRLNMNDGAVVRGNSVGVRVYENSLFEMHGGLIDNSGVVGISIGFGASGGIVNMHGGILRNNGTRPASVGAVNMHGNASFIMEDGELLFNVFGVTRQSGSNHVEIRGGRIAQNYRDAIFLREGSLTLGAGDIRIDGNGGEGIVIFNTTTAIGGGSIAGHDRFGILAYDAEITVTGGRIENQYAGIVLQSGAQLTMTGGVLLDNEFGIYAPHSSVELIGGSITGSANTGVRAHGDATVVLGEGNAQIFGGAYGVRITDGHLTMSGGTIIRSQIGIRSQDTTLDITGGSLENEDHDILASDSNLTMCSSVASANDQNILAEGGTFRIIRSQ